MKKKAKEVESVSATETTSETTKKGIDKLTITFPNVDSNKLVEKINEIIDKLNDSI